MAGFLRELGRRNVLRAGVLYITSVWALAQGITALGPTLGAPDWTTRWFLAAAAIGFPFWIAFAWFYELTPQGIKLESEVVQSESLTRATGRKLDFWIIGVLVMAVVLLLTDRFMRRGTDSTPAPVIAEKSVAVLPLVNESGDANALYFSDGLSEAFITALSQFSGLKVIARASSFQFRNSKDPVGVIGEKLGVAHLLEGSVQRAGDDVRISAELVNVRDGTELWSEHYDRPFKDLFQLQDDITNAVAAAMKAKLMGATMADLQSNRPRSGNLAAYDALLEGVFYGHRSTAKDQRNATAAFARAVKLDPAYAAAWSGLSDSENIAALYSDVSGSALAQALAQSRKDAEHALRLAPNLARAHMALGNVLISESNWTGAEAEFRRALQLAPGDPGGEANLTVALGILGQPEKAVALLTHILARDPFRSDLSSTLAVNLLALGRLDEAEAAIRKAIALQPDGYCFHVTLAEIDILRGNAKAALLDAQQEPAGVIQDVGVTFALQIGRDRAAADTALKTLIAKHSQDAAFQIAETYGLRNDTDDMFAWLEKARAANDPGLSGLLTDPFIMPHRHDPRFAKFCAETKLPVPG